MAALGPGDLVKTPLIMKQFMCVFRQKKHLPKYDYRVLIRTLISLENTIQDIQLHINKYISINIGVLFFSSYFPDE